MLLLPLFFQLALALQRVKLLLDVFGALILMGVEHNITTAQTFFDLDQSEFNSRPKLMQPNGHLGVLLLVLIIGRERNFTVWKII